MQAGRQEDAARHLREAIRFDDNAQRRYNLALVYRRQGQWLEAEAELQG